MEIKWIYRTALWAAVLSLLTSLVVTLFQDVWSGVAVLLGTSWGLLNLYFIKKTIQELLKCESRNNFIFVIFLQIKFPILYLMGYGLIRLEMLPSVYLVVGFSLIFFATFVLGLVEFFSNQLNPLRVDTSSTNESL